ncbi:MAG: hypothetical protein NTX03_01530 [Bacteroidetes bacterium]|nr:hypothetical protein [Bacteroidota bacterium]
MKKNLLLMLMVTLCVTLNSCFKSSTSLAITLTDDSGSKVSGASVDLYASLSDYNNGTNKVKTETSDASGVATFTGLSGIQYYWAAESGCKNNKNGIRTSTAPLVEGKASTIGTILYSSGMLQLINSSSNPYKIYINTVEQFDMDGGTTKKVSMKVGTYSIRVLQKSGYLVYPTDKSFSVTTSCGNTTDLIYP